MKHFLSLVYGVLILLGIWGVTPVYAYLDPGTGSMLLQLLLGGVAGLAMLAKMYWSKIKHFLGRGLKNRSNSDSDKLDQ